MAASSKTDKKAIGAFYTPRPMADALVRWCLRAPGETMIDTACGGAVFMQSAMDHLRDLGSADPVSQVYGVDIDPTAVAQARRAVDATRVAKADFFALEPAQAGRFDANVGNPPYVRYQDWDADASRAHAICEAEGVPLTRLASLWAPYVIHGCRFLRPGGRIGQVLPAEIMHAQYAAPVVEYLTARFARLTLAVFTERVFPGAQEEVVLLFAEGYGAGPARGIGMVHVKTFDDLDITMIDGVGDGYLDPQMGHLTSLPTGAAAVYRTLIDHDDVTTLGEIATVGIGAVTGANAFFLRRADEVRDAGYAPSLFRPAVSKAADIQGAALSTADLDALAERGRPTRLLVARADDAPAALATIQSLIQAGEAEGLHLRYKCRIREPWWAVPLPGGGVPDLLLTYMCDAAPRLVLNRADALSTNTIHNVWMRGRRSAAALAAAFPNSLTLLSAELVGRSYGGGLLKLEPTEAGRLLVPAHPSRLARRLAAVDRRLRTGEIERVIADNDRALLAPLGLVTRDIQALRDARAALVERRQARAAA